MYHRPFARVHTQERAHVAGPSSGRIDVEKSLAQLDARHVPVFFAKAAHVAAGAQPVLEAHVADIFVDTLVSAPNRFLTGSSVVVRSGRIRREDLESERPCRGPVRL